MILSKEEKFALRMALSEREGGGGGSGREEGGKGEEREETDTERHVVSPLIQSVCYLYVCELHCVLHLASETSLKISKGFNRKSIYTEVSI
jgi:hypothetical protein